MPEAKKNCSTCKGTGRVPAFSKPAGRFAPKKARDVSCPDCGGTGKKAAKKSTMTDAERHKRFVEMAREVGASESPRAFDRAFKRVAGKDSPAKPEKGGE